MVKKLGILGRPNVGKSTLFNILTRTRKAVVKNLSGVTRDLLIEEAKWWGHTFEVVDTGGLTDSQDLFSKLIKEQVVNYLPIFDFLIVILDGRAGLIPEDKQVVQLAKESGVPFLVLVNKVDQFHKKDVALSDFYKLGVDLMPVSFEKYIQVDEVIEWIISHIKTEEEGKDLSQFTKLCLVGKPNVGKSSLYNNLIGHKRVLVSEQAGTTIDSVEDSFEYDGNKYVIVDTAGLRRNTKKEHLEVLSVYKSEHSIAAADIVLLLVSAVEGPTVQDARILEKILSEHKTPILVANKSDQAKVDVPAFRKKFREQVAEIFRFYPDIPIVFTSAVTGSGKKDLFNTISDTWKLLNKKIPTAKLNKFFYEAIRQAPAPVYRQRDVKFYYLTQTNQKPPSFIAFANFPDGVSPSYRRFLIKKIKTEWNWHGVPMRIFVMKK
ncbi:MAG: ribosome biogenesis GTPase Der [Bdellovibrionaceae bacterium]|nr:ribosome biogenesis GTPase Der [Pseudobdellovibrionaceae bacterium]